MDEFEANRIVEDLAEAETTMPLPAGWPYEQLKALAIRSQEQDRELANVKYHLNLAGSDD